MNQITLDHVSHYRVKVGGVWMHAVGLGSEAVVRKQLEDADPLWTRASVELVASRGVLDWLGPFPRPGGVKIWTVEVEAD